MGEVRVFENTEELSTNLADHVAQLSEAAVKERGAFSLAFSGGNVPKFLRKLTGGPHLRTVDWSKWHVFWADENLVPKRHPSSNYRQAKDDFLSKVPVLPGHVYPVNVGVPGERAAEEYEFAIRQNVRNRTVDVFRRSDCPRFDLVLMAVRPTAALPPCSRVTPSSRKRRARTNGSPPSPARSSASLSPFPSSTPRPTSRSSPPLPPSACLTLPPPSASRQSMGSSSHLVPGCRCLLLVNLGFIVPSMESPFCTSL